MGGGVGQGLGQVMGTCHHTSAAHNHCPNGNFIALRSLSSLVECKATRRDFLKDRDKPFRKDPSKGIGTVRIYLTNPGVCTPDELPERWQLIEAVDEDTLVVRKGAKGCLQMGLGWYFPEKDHKAEADLLYSWAWRKLNGYLKEIPKTGRRLSIGKSNEKEKTI